MITPAYAQSAAESSSSVIMTILPLILIGGVFYLFLIRPQQKRIKDHQAMVSAVRRGDIIVTSGGVVGKIAKVVNEREVMIEIADQVTVRLVKSMISEVRSKSDNETT